MVKYFVYLWSLIAGVFDVEIIFEDGTSHHISDCVEIVWNHDDISECFNPTKP